LLEALLVPYSHARQSDVEAPAPEPEAQQEPAVSQSNDVAKQEAADAPFEEEDSWLAHLGLSGFTSGEGHGNRDDPGSDSDDAGLFDRLRAGAEGLVEGMDEMTGGALSEWSADFEKRMEARRKMKAKPITKEEREKIGAKVGTVHDALSSYGKGDGAAVTKALMGMDEREAHVFMELYNDRLIRDAKENGEEPPEKWTRRDLEDRLNENLTALDAHEAAIHLKGDPVEGAKARLAGAVGDLDFMNAALKRKQRYMERRSGKRSGASKLTGWAKDAYDNQRDSAASAGRLLDDKEDRIADVMDTLTPEQRRELMKDDEFQEELKDEVSDSLDGTEQDAWNAWAEGDEDLEVSDLARDSARAKKRDAVQKAMLATRGASSIDELSTQQRLQLSAGVKKSLDDYAESDAFETDAADAQRKANRMAAQMEEALHGTGSLTDHRTYGGWFEELQEYAGNDAYANLDTDRDAVSKLLVEMKDDPAMYAMVAERFVKNKADFEGVDPKDLLVDEEGNAIPATQLMADEIAIETSRGDFDPLSVPRKLATGAERLLDGETDLTPAELADDGTREKGRIPDLQLQQIATNKQLDAAFADAETASGYKNLKTTWEATASDPALRAAVEADLKKKGVDLSSITNLEAKKKDLEVTERATRLLACAKGGDYKGQGEMFDLLRDPAYTKGIRDIEIELSRNPNLTPERRAELETKRTTLEQEFGERKAELNAKIAEISGETGKQYAGVDDMLSDVMWGEERSDKGLKADLLGPDKERWAKKIFDQGGLKPHEEVYFQIKGYGTDDNGKKLAGVLANRTPAEIQEIATQFDLDFPGEIWSTTGWGYREAVDDPMKYFRYALENDVSGMAGMKVDQALLGDPKAVYDPDAKWSKDMTPEQRTEAAKQRLAIERKRLDLEFEHGTSGIGDIDNDANTDGAHFDAGTQLQKQNARIKKYMDDPAIRAKLEAGDPATWERYEQLAGYHASDTGTLDKVKAEIGDDVATGFEIAGLVATTIATGGGASPALVTALGAAVGLTGVAVEKGIKGGQMTNEELNQKLGQILLAMGSDAAFDKSKFLKALDEAGGELPKEIADKLLEAGTNENSLRDDHLDERMTEGALDAGKSKLLDAASDKGAEKLVGPKKAGEAHRKSVKRAMAKAGIEGGAGLAIDPALWKGELGVEGVVKAGAGVLKNVGIAGLKTAAARKGLQNAMKRDAYDPDEHGSAEGLAPEDLDALKAHYEGTNEDGTPREMPPKVAQALYGRLTDETRSVTPDQKAWLENTVKPAEEKRRVDAKQAAMKKAYAALPHADRRIVPEDEAGPFLEKRAENLAATYRNNIDPRTGKPKRPMRPEDLAILQAYAPASLRPEDRDPNLSFLLESETGQAAAESEARRRALATLPDDERYAHRDPDDPQTIALMEKKARGSIARRYELGNASPGDIAVLQAYAPHLLKRGDRDPALDHLIEDRYQDEVRAEARAQAMRALPESERQGRPWETDAALKRRAEAIVASGEVPSGEDLAILRFAMPEALPPELRNGDLRIGLGG
jgi:hypothetical protein